MLGTLTLATGVRAQEVHPVVGTGAMPPMSIAGLTDVRPYAPMSNSRAWLSRVAGVRERRQELLAAGRLDGLAPTEAAKLGAALSGTLRVLVVPVLYAGERAPFPAKLLEQRLFGQPQGDTVSYASFFDEVSDGLLHVTGSVTSWVRLPHPAGWYLPKEQYGWGHFGRVNELRQEALKRVERSVDMGRFDNDGPDGKPNSGDDDGFTDFVVFVYALPCGAKADQRSGAIWPHRGAMKPFVTQTPSKSGGFEKVADYLILPAVNPRTCGPLQVGVLAHETGHALGLPDLYDYAGNSQGIGAWGLMGTGSHSAPYSPAHFSAWSLEQLGWVKEVWLRHDSTAFSFSPVETSHTVYRYDLPNTRGQYLLLSNRQRLGSDKALPGHGLLIWHVDPERGELGMWNSDDRRPAVSVLRASAAADSFDARLAGPADPYPGLGNRRQFEYAASSGLRLTRIRERGNVVTADVHVSSAVAARSGSVPPVVWLAATQGAAPVGQVLEIDSASAQARDWSPAGTAPWLHAHRDGDALVISADPAALAPGAYADTLSLRAPDDEGFARKVVVALDVAARDGAEVVASDVPWSWGLAVGNGRTLQASYGWDPLELRPRPQVLQLDPENPFPRTLARIPSDALYAPVLTPDGDAYVIARAKHANLLYRLHPNGSAAFVARLRGSAPAYGAAELSDGSVLVADWSGLIQRVRPDGSVSHFASLQQHLYQLSADSAGDVFAATYDGNVLRIGADRHLASFSTRFGRGRLVAVAATPGGEVYAAERGGRGRLLRFASNGHVDWSIAIPGAKFYGLAVDGNFLYALDLGHGELLRIPLGGSGPTRSATSSGQTATGGRAPSSSTDARNTATGR